MARDQKIHYETSIGNVRYDLTTRKASMVVGDPSKTHAVIDEDGNAHLERQIGNWRINLDNGDITATL